MLSADAAQAVPDMHDVHDVPPMPQARMLQALRSDGVLVFEGLLAHRIASAADEHRRVTAGHFADIRVSMELDGEKIFVLGDDLLRAQGLRHLADMLAAPWFVALANDYLGTAEPAPHVYSIALDGAKQAADGPGNHHLHWDPTLSLRMMVYVGDTDRRNGALEVIAGTHLLNHRRRLDEWAGGIAYQPRPVCAGRLEDTEVVEGRAGTVIVFDTSVSHRRGLVAPGHTRRVAFAHMHSALAAAQMAGMPHAQAADHLLWPHATALP
jgi:hypothetical protein